VNGIFNEGLTSLEEGLELLQEEKSSEAKGPFELFNKATSKAIKLTIPTSKIFETPIEILHVALDENHDYINCPRLHIEAKNYSKAFIMEHFVCMAKNEDPYYFVNALTEIECGEGSFVEHVKCQRDSSRAIHIAQVKANVGKDAHFKSFTLSLGANLARNNIYSYLENTWANTSVHGLFVIKEKQQCDNFSVIDHKVSHTTSNQLFKGVLDENAHGIFTGKVIVNPDAQQVNSSQLNKNLLLNKKSRVNTRPILEIEADDVKCAHGATIGQIDENQAFYLRTRGMSQRKAQEILCHAFIQEALDKITNEEIKKFLGPILEKRFGQFQILTEGEAHDRH
jgi:Fe-S cluster assembly protein SufD